jgi:undecaprenyl-diphosphatase
MNWYLIILILALIQGAAELLPVSSSAHVILAERLLGLDPAAPEMVFLLVMLHTGTMIAVLYYFWPRWRRLGQSSDLPGGPGGGTTKLRFLALVILATAVTGVLGYGLKVLIEEVVLARSPGQPRAEVEDLFNNLPLIAAALGAVGLLIIAAGRLTRADEALTPTAPTREGGEVTTGSAILIGLVQGLCLPFRGFSRSGATISVALFTGVARHRAEEFSFALAVALTPPVIARGLYKLLRAREWHSHAELLNLLLPGLLGMVLSFIAGLVALKLLSAALDRGRWQYFGYYCLLAALVVLAVSQGWVLSGFPTARPAP